MKCPNVSLVLLGCLLLATQALAYCDQQTDCYDCTYHSCLWLETRSGAPDVAEGVCVSRSQWVLSYREDSRYQLPIDNGAKCPSDLDCAVPTCFQCLYNKCVWNAFKSPIGIEGVARCEPHSHVRARTRFSTYDHGALISLKDASNPQETCKTNGQDNMQQSREEIYLNGIRRLSMGESLSASTANFLFEHAAAKRNEQIVSRVIADYREDLQPQSIFAAAASQFKDEGAPSAKILELCLENSDASISLLLMITKEVFKFYSDYPDIFRDLLPHLLDMGVLNDMEDPLKAVVEGNSAELFRTVTKWMKGVDFEFKLTEDEMDSAVEFNNLHLVEALLEAGAEVTWQHVEWVVNEIAAYPFDEAKLELADLLISKAPADDEETDVKAIWDVFVRMLWQNTDDDSYPDKKVDFYFKYAKGVSKQIYTDMIGVAPTQHTWYALMAAALYDAHSTLSSDLESDLELISSYVVSSETSEVKAKLLRACWRMLLLVAYEEGVTDTESFALFQSRLEQVEEHHLLSYFLSLASPALWSAVIGDEKFGIADAKQWFVDVELGDLMQQVRSAEDSKAMATVLTQYLRRVTLEGVLYALRRRVVPLHDPAHGIVDSSKDVDKYFTSKVGHPLVKFAKTFCLPVDVVSLTLRSLHDRIGKHLEKELHTNSNTLADALNSLLGKQATGLDKLSPSLNCLESTGSVNVIKALDDDLAAVDQYSRLFQYFVKQSSGAEELKRRMALCLHYGVKITSSQNRWDVKLHLLHLLGAAISAEVEALATMANDAPLPRKMKMVVADASYEEFILMNMVSDLKMNGPVTSKAPWPAQSLSVSRLAAIYVVRAAGGTCHTIRPITSLVRSLPEVLGLSFDDDQFQTRWFAAAAQIKHMSTPLEQYIVDTIKYLQESKVSSKLPKSDELVKSDVNDSKRRAAKSVAPKMEVVCSQFLTDLKLLPIGLLLTMDAGSGTIDYELFEQKSPSEVLDASVDHFINMFEVSPLDQDGGSESPLDMKQRVALALQDTIFHERWPQPHLIFKYRALMEKKGHTEVVSAFNAWVKAVAGLGPTLQSLRYETPKNQLSFEHMSDELVKKWRETKLASEDPATLFLLGEYAQSCQAITSTMSYNQALVGYLLNGNTKAIVLNPAEDGNGFAARAVVRLVDLRSSSSVTPILLLEPGYAGNRKDVIQEHVIEPEIFRHGKQLASELGVPMLFLKTVYPSVTEPCMDRSSSDVLVIRGGLAPYLYSDIVGSSSGSHYSYELPLAGFEDNAACIIPPQTD